ncbi:ADP-ribose pyrophosphatase YjhB (NUDIX family) [Chitinophaga dinghuensis]|uniref:ADP-ribose pyrophosphatase YjhB (NUDIX family) n=1 Tax=Chitinophaga dinghuensis TaxID=1539050 RepID=A0A327VK70_9BACT|nr:NUDIX domain-containing protein [Chitinophaga dinghuensis]RAJ75100.1 ADP-ribose pyrophosphatase YjhB (NUDIX family) [Chitinophaga dinghuensis]
MRYINTVGLIALENRKLLLAFSSNKKAWYLPGGKVDPGETNLAAIIREIKEELNLDLTAGDLQEYYYIEAPAFGEQQTLMKQHTYLCQLKTTPQPTAEIAAVKFFSPVDYAHEEHQVPGVLKAFHQLKADGLID